MSDPGTGPGAPGVPGHEHADADSADTTATPPHDERGAA
jgi:hypothetical protein